MTLVTKYQISAINSYWEKCDEKYLGRTDRGKTVYPPPPSGSGGITNWKDMTIIYNANILNCLILFTLQCLHNQDPSFNSTITHYLYSRKIFTKVIFIYSFTSVRPSKILFVTFFSVTVDGWNLIFGHKCHISILYCG
jgi:hypothetical protein